jgi:phosphatidylserine/phosphatidylglycerophosphate/cardiolipin synthase-like enzyme
MDVTATMKPSDPSKGNPRFRIFFGGPDCRPRTLRDMLDSHVSAVPPGGEIFWATYYFRDLALADALVQSRKRGVKVRLTLEANPRTARANLPVLEMLQGAANLDGDCRSLRHKWPDNLRWKKPRLHIKLYYFSHPEPHVLVGTFNPSGNSPEDPEIVAEIGDQDRGHNFLVEVSDSRLVLPLREHLVRLHEGHHGPWERLLPHNNRVLTAGDSRIYLFPRLRRDVIRRKLLTLPAGTVLRMAISHLNDEAMGKTLLQLTKRGVEVEILAHDTERRVPVWMEDLLGGQLLFRRYRHSQGLPMHNKFILIDTKLSREVIFGSMNLSNNSLHANHEILVVSASTSLYDAFRERWEQMVEESEAMPS